MNLYVKDKPTIKKTTMALILQSRRSGICYYCENKITVRVGIFPNKSGFEVRHMCERHKGFGLW